MSFESIWSYISNSFDGTYSYVYMWVSKKWRVIYVGQTNDACGTIGRALNHTRPNGTLRARFEEEAGRPLEEADDLVLISFPLPKKAEFLSLESSYREAVEYLVQVKLRTIRGNLEPKFKIISNVRYTDRAANQLVQKYAEDIVSDFVSNFSQLNN